MSNTDAKIGTPDADTPTSVQSLLDAAPFGRRRVIIFVLAFLAMMLEGIEVQMWGFVYPQIIAEWGTSLTTITTIVTVGVVALTLGAMVAGPLADRLGRKPIVVVGAAAFGLATLGGALATNELMLGTTRTIACLGLGAVMPLVITLVAEIMPSRRRTNIVGITFAGFPLGTVVTGALAGALIPALGWRALLGVGGILALILVPLLAWGMPESVAFLARRGHRTRLDQVLVKIVPDFKTTDLAHIAPVTTVSQPRSIGTLLSRRYIRDAIVVWFCYFVTAGVVYIFLNYLPLIASAIGASAAVAGLAVALMGILGVVGALSIGYLMSKFGRHLVIGLYFTLAATTVWVMASVSLAAGVLIGVSAIIGFTVVGLNSGMNAFSTADEVFPVESRATGVSWMHGFGKAGSIVSGFFGGTMLAAGWGIGQIYFTLGFPLILGAIAIAALRWSGRRRTSVSS
ncbi:MFS transporter [Arthrobacter sp. NtRootA1]|uniref:MFS transporter n=1 Tax=Arthrobacter sp. NtRootA1 TaxID=2830983 RepID=UPI001CC345AC|nr:MFS transporter [Arthrobacter sp. NtRootA1]BCW05701.1 MFS transporter [Arthrobacter sp. NtRootA1]